MKQDSACPLCTAEPAEAYRVSISPFLRERMFASSGPRECHLLHCEQCNFYYYDIRPDEKEMAAYYSGYRSSVYQMQRQSFEKTYNHAYNEMIGNSPDEVASRIANLERVLAGNGVSVSTDVLDYGGNDGRFIPPGITGSKYCFDISNNATVEGVSGIDETGLISRRFGLVLLCHVLEHIPYPVEIVQRAASLLRGDGYLYIELPSEMSIVNMIKGKSRSFSGMLVGLLKRSRPTWILPKMSFGVSPGFHEHVNFFTPCSLEKLLASEGLELLEAGEKRLDFGWSESDILYCLAKKV